MVATERRKWLALALLSAVQFMVVLDIAIVNVALPSIKIDLGFSQENLQWVISAYALFFGGFLLLGGRAADLLGRRRLFLAGLVLFTLSSLLAGLAWSEGSLIAARSFQGLGAAVISPAALSILSTTFTEGRERNVALGVWGAVGGFGAAAGVLLGGVLTETLSWSWIFFVNVPVGVAAFFLGPRLLDESRDMTVKSFDALGAVLVTAGLVSLVYAITQSGTYGWGSARTIGVITAAAALLAAFGWWERRHAEPLMRFGILRTKTVAGANVGGLILGTATFSLFLMLTLYMQQVLGYSPMKTGVAYLAVAGSAILWSGVAAQLVNRVGVKPVLVAGMVALTGGLVYFTPGLRSRHVFQRPAARLPARGRRYRLLVRADLDRRAGRRPARRGWARIRSVQHDAADRRCPGHLGAVDDRDVADLACTRGRVRAAVGAGAWVHRRVRCRRRHRSCRCRDGPDAHPARRARAGSGAAGDRDRARPRGLVHPAVSSVGYSADGSAFVGRTQGAPIVVLSGRPRTQSRTARRRREPAGTCGWVYFGKSLVGGASAPPASVRGRASSTLFRHTPVAHLPPSSP